MNFQNLKEARISNNLTMKQTAEYLGISVNTYQKYEYGTREPNGDTIVQLADLFGVTTDYLLGRTEPTSRTKPLDIIAQQTNMEAAEKAALEKWLSLNKSHRESVLQIMRDIIKAAEAADNHSSDDGYIIETTTISELKARQAAEIAAAEDAVG